MSWEECQKRIVFFLSKFFIFAKNNCLLKSQEKESFILFYREIEYWLYKVIIKTIFILEEVIFLIIASNIEAGGINLEHYLHLAINWLCIFSQSISKDLNKSGFDRFDCGPSSNVFDNRKFIKESNLISSLLCCAVYPSITYNLVWQNWY